MTSNNKKWLIIPVILLLAAGSIGAWIYSGASDSAEAEGDIAANESITPAAGEDEAVVTEQAVTDQPAADGPQSTAADATSVSPKDIRVTVNGTDPKFPRSIGSIDAPVTIVEYSSLTCPHCAHAHETVLPQLIRDYVDTGKVRIVFNDFPLNKEAMDASKVSRCVSNDQYFNFLTLLFSDIEAWAYSGNHPNALITNATLTGLSPERAKECLNDPKLEQALLEGIQAATGGKNAVSSTPTFILNDGAKVIQGARPYGEFKAAIDALLAPKAE
jgi:protein-disulfide isomerase